MSHYDETAQRAVEEAENAIYNELLHDPVSDDLDTSSFDVRLAAAINMIDIAKEQGGHREWTTEHARKLRALLAITGAVVVGENGAGNVPQGFGAPVRTYNAMLLDKAKAEQAKHGAAAVRTAIEEATKKMNSAAGTLTTLAAETGAPIALSAKAEANGG